MGSLGPLMQETHYNHVINHIGLCVPDVEAAMQWYTTVLGFIQLGGIKIEDANVDTNTAFFTLFPPKTVRKAKIGHLTTGNGVGFELFEWVEPRVPEERQASFCSGRDLTRGGLFHFSITAPNVEALGQKIEQSGGKRVAGTAHVWGVDGLYMEDPWGNAIEIISQSYEALLCNRPDGRLRMDQSAKQ